MLKDDIRVRHFLDKQEIREVLYRWCRGLDRGDAELMSTTYHPDAVDEHGTNVYTGLTAGPSYVEKHLALFKSHLHCTHNEQIIIDGDSAACESYFLAWLVPKSSGPEQLVFAGGRYLDRFERRAGEWRIARRRAFVEWRARSPLVSDTDWRSMRRPDELARFGLSMTTDESKGATHTGLRSRLDPSYEFLPPVDAKPVKTQP